MDTSQTQSTGKRANVEIVYLLLIISMVLVTIIVVVFVWAVNEEQFDDLEGPGHRIVADNDAPDPRALHQQQKRHSESLKD